MSEAVPGDGILRGKIAEAGSAARRAVDEANAKIRQYHDLMAPNEVETRNNQTTESSKVELDNIEVMRGVLSSASETLIPAGVIMGRAHDHHKAQPSVLPNNILGQRRRKLADGTVKIVDPVDPQKLYSAVKSAGVNTQDPDAFSDWIRTAMKSP